MTVYQVKAYDQATGATSIYEIEAPSENAAQSQIAQSGAVALSIRARANLFPNFSKSFGRYSSLLFCQEMLGLLDAGIGLAEAIEVLQEKARDPETRRVLYQVVVKVDEGLTLSDAMHRAVGDDGETAFPMLLVATIKSAEQTSQLPHALRRYLKYQEELTAVRDKVIAAAVYPLLLLGVGLLVILFLMTYVVPRFSQIYADVGSDHLPLLSRWLMLWGVLINNNLAYVFAILVLLLGLTAYGVTRDSSRAWLSASLWKLPRVGEHFRTYQLAQFVRTLSMLLSGGVPLVRALDMTRDFLRQPALANGLLAARESIAQGKSVSESFRVNGLATQVGFRLLVVGERSGDLGQVMERIAVFYDAEVSRAVAWFSRLFEPVLMIFIGLLIGGIIILMYLPIFELAGSIQ